MNEFLNQIVPLLITCILGILAVMIKSVGDVVIKFLVAKKEEAIAKLGQTEYTRRISAAHDIWGIVDEHFRINDALQYTIDDKVNLFNKLLLQRIPDLEPEDLDYLRQTIAGQVNYGKEVLTAPKEE